MKYRNQRGPYRWAAEQMAMRVSERDFDCITWVPSSSTGHHLRGFEPGHLLARHLSNFVRIADVPLLKRAAEASRVGQGRAQRVLEGPALRPRLATSAVRRVLLVDDVCTTGTTLSTAANALRSQGVIYVGAVVAARAP